jgi:rSAM/selenodomain-associated transferase 2
VRIAVVIPTLREADHIQDAVRSARAPGVEVIVADGGSRDATCERAREAGARVVASAPGRARQLQAGALATTDVEAILFLHADTQLPEGWTDAVVGALAVPGVAGGAFAFRFAERGTGLRFIGLRFIEWGVRLRLALARLPYGDQAIFVRRDAFDAMGGVPQAPIMEDLDLVREIRRRGKLVLLPLAVWTSARRYRQRGILRTWLRNTAALTAWRLGVDRERLAAWYRR